MITTAVIIVLISMVFWISVEAKESAKRADYYARLLEGKKQFKDTEFVAELDSKAKETCSCKLPKKG